MVVSIIIVNWNSDEYAKKCIASIYEWTHEVPFEVIVVDNASPSSNMDDVKSRFPEIELIKSSKNLGFAGANNFAFEHSSGDALLFLNPDTKLASAAIDLMMRQMSELPDAGIMGCRLLNADLSVQTSSIMKFPRIWNSLLKIEYLRLRWPKLWGIAALFSPRAKPTEVEAVSGACMLIRREVFERIGRFSEDYFMYSEDLDLCYQAVRGGFKNYYVGSATIVHYGGKSSSRAWQTAMKTKAELHFCEKNYGRFYSILFRWTMVINASVRLLFLAGMRLVAKVFHTKNTLDPTWLRWRVIFKTLVSSGAAVAERPMIPTSS